MESNPAPTKPIRRPTILDKTSLRLPLPVPPRVTRITLAELLDGQSLEALECEPQDTESPATS